MDSLVITTSTKRLALMRDGEQTGEISFDPSDVILAEKFYNLVGEFKSKLKEYEPIAERLDANKEKDEYGLPVNFGEKLGLFREVCEFVYSRIDQLFGIGTSEAAFGGKQDVDLITQFLDGIKPHFQKVRSEKVAKYTSVDSAKRNKRSNKRK